MYGQYIYCSILSLQVCTTYNNFLFLTQLISQGCEVRQKYYEAPLSFNESSSPNLLSFSHQNLIYIPDQRFLSTVECARDAAVSCNQVAGEALTNDCLFLAF